MTDEEWLAKARELDALRDGLSRACDDNRLRNRVFGAALLLWLLTITYNAWKVWT